MRQISPAAATIPQPADMIPNYRVQALGLSFYHVLVWLLLFTTTWSSSRAFNPLIEQFKYYGSSPSKTNDFSLYLTKNWEPSSLLWRSRRSKALGVPLTSQPIPSDVLLTILKRLEAGNDGKIGSTESNIGNLLNIDQSNEKDMERVLDIDQSAHEDSTDLVKMRKVEAIRKLLRRRHKIDVSGKERQLAKGRTPSNKLVNLSEQWKKIPTHQSRRSKKLTNHRQSTPMMLPGTQNVDSYVLSDMLFGGSRASEPVTATSFIGARQHVTDSEPIGAEGFIGEQHRVNDQDLFTFPRRDVLPVESSLGQDFSMPHRLFGREISEYVAGSWKDEHISSSFFPEISQDQHNDTFSSSSAGFSGFGPAPQSQFARDLLLNPSFTDVTFEEGGFDSNINDCEAITTRSCSLDEVCSCNGMYHCVSGRCALKPTQSQPYTQPGTWGVPVPF